MGFPAGSEQPAIRQRYSGSYQNHEWSATLDSADTIWIVQRNEDPDELSHLVEGEEDSELVGFETRAELRTVDDEGGHPADYVKIGLRDGSEEKRYKIVSVEPPRHRRGDRYFAVGRQV